MLGEYARLILFSVGLLSGIQFPAFVDQYAKRVDARLSEAMQNMQGFQQTADRYFDGSIDKLLSHYRSSQDVVFKDDADNIQFIYSRLQELEAQAKALDASALARAYHVLVAHNRQILQETLTQYTYVIMLDPQALLWGLCTGLLLAAMFDSFLAGGRRVVRRRKKPL